MNLALMMIAAPKSSSSGGLTAFLPFLVLIVVFYFLLIRPQRRRQQQHQALIKSIEVGDEVLTIGGLYGIVREANDEFIHIEVSPGTVLKYARFAVSRKVEHETVSEDGSETAD